MPEFLNVPAIVGAFIVLDVVTGMAQAAYNRELRSDKLRRGLFHKMAFAFAVVLAYLIEYSMGLIDLGFTVPVAVPVCGYICLTEIVSIVENITLINPELANKKFVSLLGSTKED